MSDLSLLRLVRAHADNGRGIINSDLDGHTFWTEVAEALGYRVASWTWHLNANMCRPGGSLWHVEFTDALQILRLAGKLKA